MPRKRKDSDETDDRKDRHKPAKYIRVKERLAAQLAVLAEIRATDVTEEVNRAVRELLEREKLWPPPGSGR
jgi:hypothetical protein